jgi:hypothetical protein
MLSRLLRSYLRPYRRPLAVVLLLQLVGTMASLYLPSLNADIIDKGEHGLLHALGDVVGRHCRPPNCHLCTSIPVYRLGVKTARAAARSDARTRAAVPSHAAPSSDNSGP